VELASRFAPSTTGEAHPGTLLSALLVWLDGRQRENRVLLRLEDLDVTRTKQVWADQIIEACAWLGLDWDEVILQSSLRERHEAALDYLADDLRLYPCTCSRADRSGGRRAPDGGWAYDNTCRGKPLTDWRTCTDAIRVRLDDDRIELLDDSDLDLSQTPALEMGDPIVRRKDGVIAYHLAVVVDDADAAVDCVVRGRDIAPSTATQVMLQRLLARPPVSYRHHFLLLEAAGDKLAKLHGSLPFSQLRQRFTGPALCGVLAHLAGLIDQPRNITPAELLADFDWDRVTTEDRVF
jgi:glutamyl-Q tRNA(Asp) synthetase